MAKGRVKSGLRSMDVSREDQAYVRETEKERSEVLSQKPNKQAVYLMEAEFLSHDEALDAWRNGSITTKVNEYFDLLRENGNVVAKPTTGDNVGVSRGDIEAQRLQYIMDQSGMSESEARKVLEASKIWFSGKMSTPEVTKVLDDYIDKAPAYKGTIYRGVKMETAEEMESFLKNIKPGGVITPGLDKSNSSWSHSEEMSMHYAGRDPERSVMLVDVSKRRTATPAARISHQGEEEVLASSKAQYTVLRSERKGDRLYVYVIERGR